MRRYQGVHEEGFNHVSEADGGFLIRCRRTIFMMMNAEHNPTANDHDALTAREAGLRALVDTLTAGIVTTEVKALYDAWLVLTDQGAKYKSRIFLSKAVIVLCQYRKCRDADHLSNYDYSAVISKYLGDTAKHIAQAFARAAELGAVLFFDEADSLLSRRVDMNESCATSINQNRNVLMQCLDRFDGIVIMTTNLFGNYDPALLRRIARHIEFKLPDRSMRGRLFELHLPNRERVNADLETLAGATQGLSGGDILNVCVNAIFAGSTADDPAEWLITQAVLLVEIAKVREAERQHDEGCPTLRKRTKGHASCESESEFCPKPE